MSIIGIQEDIMMNALASEFKYITPITLSDRRFINAHFASTSSTTYGNSWSYIVQGMHGVGKDGMGYKFFNGKDLFFLCFYPKIEDGFKVPLYIIRPSISSSAGYEIILAIANFVKKTFNQNTYVKKLFENQYQTLLQMGFKDVSLNPWHTLAVAEDDTYPEVILDVEETLRQAKYLGKTRQLSRSFSNYLKIEKDNEFELSSVFKFKEKSIRLIERFFEQRSYLVSKPEDYFNLIYKHNFISRYIEHIVLFEGEAVALYISEKIAHDEVALYATITDRFFMNNMTDFVMFNLLKNLHKKKIAYLNLGGSEFDTLHLFKLKFKPVKTHKMYWCFF